MATVQRLPDCSFNTLTCTRLGRPGPIAGTAIPSKCLLSSAVSKTIGSVGICGNGLCWSDLGNVFFLPQELLWPLTNRRSDSLDNLDSVFAPGIPPAGYAGPSSQLPAHLGVSTKASNT